jgi:hypothetical protein
MGFNWTEQHEASDDETDTGFVIEHRFNQVKNRYEGWVARANPSGKGWETIGDMYQTKGAAQHACEAYAAWRAPAKPV